MQNGGLQDHTLQQKITCIAKESAQIATAEQIHFTEEGLLKTINQVIIATAENYSSMNRDLFFLRNTENEFIKDPAKYKDAVKIAYCTISYRSGKFAQKLQKKGIPVYNLKGGILAWVHDGGKVYDLNGETHRIHVYGRKWNLGPKGYQAVW